ncbi:hypothetical protein IKE_05621 [Bacillus cereus VD196]|uniref:SCP domain-containing protein n=1 Tax=Bacillus cereus VD196 TaxID=1053243 RepID=A0A9W5PYY5_BACCE|nr:CAP domain-containing protein [Bacillus cereus]EOO62656.1 hypothetical protein IKE_05621 [Bacillus cereus VD196]
MKKRALLSVAAATALTLGISSLNAQAATVQPYHMQHSKVIMQQMSQEELQAYLQSMVQWNQGQFQQGCPVPGQQPNVPTGNVVTVPTTKPAEEAKPVSEFEQRVVELTNAERTKQGLPALQIDTELSKVARAKSEDMQKNNYFSHNSYIYGSPFDMMKKFGISYKSAGENIAQSQRTPEEVVQTWMNSAGHRANILNYSFTHIGVGYVESGNYWTQQFITK